MTHAPVSGQHQEEENSRPLHQDQLHVRVAWVEGGGVGQWPSG